MKDLRYALSMLAKSPLVTGVAMLSLALGIGANTAMYGSLDALLLDPLRIVEPERLVHLYSTNPSGLHASILVPELSRRAGRNEAFTGMVASAKLRSFS